MDVLGSGMNASFRSYHYFLVTKSVLTQLADLVLHTLNYMTDSR